MAGDGYPSTTYSYYTLALLWGVYVSNQWARYLLNYLYAISSENGKYSISEACGLSSSEYGLLTGYGFSATFVVTGLFVGRAADSYNRRNIIVAGCVIWNLATMGLGMSASFWELLLFRLLLGFGEAFSNPASYSMIPDLFPPEKRPTANGIFASAVYIGGGMASLSEAIAEDIGWRWMMYVTAMVGGLIALLMLLTVSEPLRLGAGASAADSVSKKDDQEEGAAEEGGGGQAATLRQKEKEEKRKRELKKKGAAVAVVEDGSAGSAAPSAWETVKFMLTDPHTVLLLAAASVRFCGGYAIGGFLPTFFEEKFPGDTKQYAYINAYVVAFGGFMSSWLGGRLTTAWIESGKRKDPSRRWPGAAKANYLVPAIGCLGGVPFFLVCLLSGNFYVSLCVGLLGEYLVAECWFGPFMSALQGGVPSTMRGFAVATMMFTANFLGSLTSYVIGVVYEATGPGYLPLTYILLVAVVGTYILSAGLFLWASMMPFSKLASESTAAGSSQEDEDDEVAESSESTHLLHGSGGSGGGGGGGSVSNPVHGSGALTGSDEEVA